MSCVYFKGQNTYLKLWMFIHFFLLLDENKNAPKNSKGKITNKRASNVFSPIITGKDI